MKKFYRIVFIYFSITTASLSAFSQECGVVYVTPNGASSGAAGTRANPANLTYGLTLVGGTATRVWLAQGTYNINNEIPLVSNITIEGGFNPATWVKSNVPPTVIHRSSQNLLPPPANATGVFAGFNVSGFRLQDLTLTMDIPNGVAATAYAIYLNGCSNYNIVRCDVTAADGTPGVAGAPGAPGAPGTAGAPGIAGRTEGAPIPGGAGGTGGNNGGNGGTVTGYKNVNGGAAGGGGCGGAGGSGGSGPDCNLGCTFGPPSCGSTTPGQPGQPGGNGTSGTNGATGPAGTITFPGYFVPGGAGTAGTSGTPGCGGGGGGGGGGRQQNGSDDWGGSGGGGGGGGGGGTGGTGGSGGGGSFAVFLYSNGAGGNIVDCRLVAGAGGAGGAGGTGSAGAAGGAGGAGGAAGVCGNGWGGNGGAGGNGGNGGAGGSGATGMSMAISETGGTPVTQSNITSVPGNPPVISVDNHGCTNAEVVFTTPVAGAWNFGSGASPATANSTGPVSVTYGSTGRKTITFGGTAFTDFIDIWQNSAAGSLSHTGNPTVTGCPDVFTETLSGTLYEWDFGATSIPQTDTTTTGQSGQVVFTTTGAKTIYVWVTTACCGRVRDSIVINVQPNTLNISLSASASSICQGTAITYTATPSSYQSYTFLINNTPVQSSASNTFSTSALVPGDSVSVLGFDGICYTNPSATLYPQINPIPAVTLSSSDADDTICSGDLVTFTATPTGYSNYTFYVNTNQQQSSATNTWATSSLAQGDSVYVIVTDNGCTSLPSNAIHTFVKPTPVVTISVPSSTICQGDNVVVTASPTGLDNYDFVLNGTSIQNSNSNTYTSSSFNNNDQIVVTGSLNGCTSQASSTITMTVNPIPVVTLSSSDSNDSICQGESVTFTATPSGYDNYNFQNNGSSVQSGISSTYTTNLLTNGNNITLIATDLGCGSPVSNPISIAVTPAPAVNAGTDMSACVDAGTQTLSGFSPAGGLWTGTGISNPSGDFSPPAAGAGSHFLIYTYIDPISGCTGYDSIVFTVNALPVISLPASVDICEGQSTQLNASGGIAYAWSPATGLDNANVSNPVASPASTTPYTVTVTDNNNCSNTASVTVNVNQNPVADFSASEVCAGLATVFMNNSSPTVGNTYTWDFGDGNNSTSVNPAHVYSLSDSFTVTLIAQLGNCYDTISNIAIVHPKAVAGFTADPLTSYTDNSIPIRFTNTSQSSDSWIWEFGDNTFSTAQSPTHVYQQPGVYTVTLIAENQYGCNDTLTRNDYIRIYQTPKVFVPNVFTPDGNGANDVLNVLTTDVKYFDFKIFNRWGEKVFESTNYLQGWDGTYKGVKSERGVYVYTVKIVFNDDTNRDIKGSVTLLR